MACELVGSVPGTSGDCVASRRSVGTWLVLIWFVAPPSRRRGDGTALPSVAAVTSNVNTEGAVSAAVGVSEPVLAPLGSAGVGVVAPTTPPFVAIQILEQQDGYGVCEC